MTRAQVLHSSHCITSSCWWFADDGGEAGFLCSFAIVGWFCHKAAFCIPCQNSSVQLLCLALLPLRQSPQTHLAWTLLAWAHLAGKEQNHAVSKAQSCREQRSKLTNIREGFAIDKFYRVQRSPHVWDGLSASTNNGSNIPIQIL